MRLFLLLAAIALSGCATRVISLKHEASLEVYVVTSMEDWRRLSDASFDSGDLATIRRFGFRCAHELKRDLHQCFYLSQRSPEEVCLQAQKAIENELGTQLTRPLRVRYSRCSNDSSKNLLIFGAPIVLVFNSRVEFDLTYNLISYGTRCASGKVSTSTGRGTCSWNGGVAGTASGWILDGERVNNLRAAYSDPQRFRK